jgi:hypothetical protein
VVYREMRISGLGRSSCTLAHAEALTALGRSDEARAELAELRTALLTRADRIADSAQRAMYLQAIPEHARILALADKTAG